MASAHLTQLIRPHPFHGLVIRLLVVLDGDLRRHTTHSMDTTLVTRLDEQLDIGIHERHRHGDRAAIRQHKVAVLAELLDGAEDIIPAAAVETRAVVTQLIDDLVHLKGSQDGLDQDGAADGAPRHADIVLAQVEGVVPQTSFEVGLHLGEVKVGTKPLLDGLEGIVEEIEAKVEKGARDGLAVDRHMLLLEVPSTWSHDESGKSPVGA